MKIIHLIVLLVFASASYGQPEKRYTILFTDLTGHPFQKIVTPYTPFSISPADHLKNIPTLADTMRIHKIVIYGPVQKYQEYLSGRLSREDFEEYVTTYKIDTTGFAKYNVKDGFHVYVGLDYALQKKYVVVDADNDNDFSNDSLYSFNIKDHDVDSVIKKAVIHAKIPIEYYDNGLVASTISRIELLPLGESGPLKYYRTTESDRHLGFVLHAANTLEGAAIINSVEVNILAHCRSLGKVSMGTHPHYYSLSFQESNDPEKRIIHAHMGDTIEIAGRVVRLSKTEGYVLHLDDLGGYSDSTRVGNYLPALYSMKVNGDGSPIRLNDAFEGKYVFIDFWGSWCAPCIASIPQLKELYETVRHREDVAVVGIALDHAKDLEKLKGIMAQKGVEWPGYWNHYNDMKLPSVPTGKLKISSFPTYMIVDKAGKIVYRTKKGGGGTKEAIGFFKKMLGEI